MADTKISALADGIAAVGTDKFPIARDAANYYLTADEIATFVTNQLAPVALSGDYGDLTGVPTLPTFRTDGVDNGSQTVLDLKAGTNITLTDDGVGGVTIDAAGGGGGSRVYTLPGGVQLDGATFKRVNGNGLAIGDNDLYTVPAGKRAMLGYYSVWNSSAGSIVTHMQVKIGGTYFRLETNTTLATAGTASLRAIGYIAEAGEIVSVNSATNNGLNLFLQVIEFDDTTPLYSPKLTSLAAADNTVYTVPVGTVAVMLDQNFNALTQLEKLFYVNGTAATVTVTPHIVNSGSAVGTSNQSDRATASAANSRAASTKGMATLEAGDKVVLTSTSAGAGQWVWTNVMEM